MSNLSQVAGNLRARLMQRGDRRTAELKLAARLDGHALPIQLSPYDAPLLLNGLPAVALH